MKQPRGFVAALLLACLCACNTAAPEPVQVPPLLEQYADACAFVPDGMQSFALLDARWFPRDDGTPHRGLLVIAGRDFKPPQVLGAGTGTGVVVHDAGTGGDAHGLLAADEVSRRVASGNIAGHDCFHVPGDPHGAVPRWHTIVDNRFLVRASDQSVLAQALQRSGSLHGILSPFAPLPQLHGGLVGTIWNLPRSAADERHATMLGIPVPDQPTITALLTDPWRLRVIAQRPLTATYERALQTLLPQPFTAGPWRGLEAHIEHIKPEPGQWTALALHLMVLFGLPIAI